ncbi:MAG TPA: GlsB/YeaQ/YmgE family stress response membrane protein [Xanthomonadaceae bacterium]|nr:GlsB/YeaQ/YmgE family stress response membrane protein [Xanthomonadaceae bacterium]
MFEGFLGYLVGGAVIGILARLIKPGADPMGWILTILLGVAGAWIGGWLSAELGVDNRLLVWAIAILAAIVLLFAYEMIRGRRRKRAVPR